MKKLLFILAVLISQIAKSQTIVPRAPASIIPVDQNLIVHRYFKIPVFADTAAANTAITGHDSIGIVFQRYSTGQFYIRDTSTGTHKWTVLASGGSSGVWGSITGTIGSQADLTAALAAKQNIITTGTAAQYITGTLGLATFPTNVSSFTNDAGYITAVPTILDTMSVTGAGVSGNRLKLVNDAVSPGAKYHYGTDGGGTKGWIPDTTIAPGVTSITANAPLTGGVITTVGSIGADTSVLATKTDFIKKIHGTVPNLMYLAGSGVSYTVPVIYDSAATRLKSSIQLYFPSGSSLGYAISQVIDNSSFGSFATSGSTTGFFTPYSSVLSADLGIVDILQNNSSATTAKAIYEAFVNNNQEMGMYYRGLGQSNSKLWFAGVQALSAADLHMRWYVGYGPNSTLTYAARTRGIEFDSAGMWYKAVPLLQSLDSTNYKLMVRNTSTGQVGEMYWPTFGGGGGGSDSAVLAGSGLTKSVVGTAITLKADTSLLATKTYVSTYSDTLRIGHTGTSTIWGGYPSPGFDSLYLKSFDGTFFTTKTDSTISVDTSAGVTHLATQGYVGAHGGGGGGSQTLDSVLGTASTRVTHARSNSFANNVWTLDSASWKFNHTGSSNALTSLIFNSDSVTNSSGINILQVNQIHTFAQNAPYRDQFAWSANGDGSDDMIHINGWNDANQDKAGKAGWSDHWEYGYLGSLMEHHNIWTPSFGGQIRVMSQTIQGGSTLGGTTNLEYHSLTGLEMRPLTSSGAFWSLSIQDTLAKSMRMQLSGFNDNIQYTLDGVNHVHSVVPTVDNTISYTLGATGARYTGITAYSNAGFRSVDLTTNGGGYVAGQNNTGQLILLIQNGTAVGGGDANAGEIYNTVNASRISFRGSNNLLAIGNSSNFAYSTTAVDNLQLLNNVYAPGSMSIGGNHILANGARLDINASIYANKDSLATSTATSRMSINIDTATGLIKKTPLYTVAYRAITALRTLDASDYMVNCTANSFTVTLPTAVGITGRMYIIKNTGTATTITIATTSSQTIDGSAPTAITTLIPLRVMSDGANWITF